MDFFKRCWVEIDLDKIEHNYKIIREFIGDKKMISVVKADAYGHGAVQVTRISPYDETEYHWALRSPTTGWWLVRRSGTGITILPARLTEEQVAAELLNLDRAAHLTRTGGIW